MKNTDLDDYLDDIDDEEPIHEEDEIKKSLYKRYRGYSRLVYAYVKYYKDKSESNIQLRKWFFGLSFSLLFLLVGGIVAFCIFVSVNATSEVAMISGIISGVAGIIVSILALPTIIGNYLFPKNEDEYIKDMINGMRMADDQQFIDSLENEKKKKADKKRQKTEK